MATAVELKGDWSSEEFRQLAAKAKDANQARRLLALAAIRDGKGRAEAARIGGMDRQTLPDWVHAVNARGLDGTRSVCFVVGLVFDGPAWARHVGAAVILVPVVLVPVVRRVLLLRTLRGDTINLVQPAAEVEVGAALRAERAVADARRFLAERTPARRRRRSC